MPKLTKVEIGDIFAALNLRAAWRVDKLLGDGIHVALISVTDETRRKTIAASALLDAELFTRIVK